MDRSVLVSTWVSIGPFSDEVMAETGGQHNSDDGTALCNSAHRFTAIKS